MAFLGWFLPGSTSCANPPIHNPNVCHLYTWNPFPNDINQIPPLSLFNNDTSYYFNVNMTAVKQFSICATVTTYSAVTGNATLVAQYLDTGLGQWTNLDSSSSRTAGSLSLSLVSTFNCSNTMGIVSATLTTSCGDGVAIGVCQLRIAGNEGICSACSGSASESLTLSELNLQLYYNPIDIGSTIVCSPTSAIAASFVVTCAQNLKYSTNTVVTVKWQANLAGAGWQAGSVTVTIVAGANTGSATVIFAPAFGAAPQVTLMQSTVFRSRITVTSSFMVNILT